MQWRHEHCDVSLLCTDHSLFANLAERLSWVESRHRGCELVIARMTSSSRPVCESESERDFSRERATIQTRSESKQANLKRHMIFHARQHVMFLSVCLSVCPSHSVTVKTVQARITKIFTVGCHKLDCSFRILETVRDSAKIRNNQL